VAVTPTELRAAVLCEQYAKATRAEVGQVLAAWSEHQQIEHIAEALEVSYGQATRILAERRQDIADDLPPRRGRTLVVRSRS
jgi:hypothetical protein